MDPTLRDDFDQQDNQSFDIVLIKKIVKSMIKESTLDNNKQLKDEYDAKFNYINQQNKSIIKKLSPLSELLQVQQSTIGKSLPEALTDYVIENGVSQQIETLRNEMLTKQLMEDFLISEYVPNYEFQRHQSDAQKNIDQLVIKVSEFENTKKQVGNDITYIRSMFTEKGDAKDLRQLEMKINECAPWEAIRNVYKELSFYLKKDDFDLYKSEFQLYQKQTFERLEQLAVKKEIMKEILTLKLNVEEEFKKYSKVIDCQNDKKEMSKYMLKIKDEITDFKRSVGRLDNDIINIKKIITQKADETEIKKINEYLADVALLSDLKHLESRVFPKIQVFEKFLEEFKSEAQQHSLIIRRYDEVLSEKASKWNIQEVYHHLDVNFAKLPNITTLDQKIEQVKKLIQEAHQNNEDRFDAINIGISQEIIKAVRKVQNQGQPQGQTNRTQFSSSNNGTIGDMSELRQLLNSKANQSEVQTLYEIKSNKVDTEQIITSQSVLSRQLKLMLVLFMESIKASMKNPNETALNRENKKKFLMTQLKALSKWILKFDPLSLNGTTGMAEQQANEFMNHEEGKVLQDFTDQIMLETISVNNSHQSQLHNYLQDFNSRRSRDRQNQSLHSSIQTPFDLQKSSINNNFGKRKISRFQNQSLVVANVTYSENNEIAVSGLNSDRQQQQPSRVIKSRKTTGLSQNKYSVKLASLDQSQINAFSKTRGSVFSMTQNYIQIDFIFILQSTSQSKITPVKNRQEPIEYINKERLVKQSYEFLEREHSQYQHQYL